MPRCRRSSAGSAATASSYQAFGIIPMIEVRERRRTSLLLEFAVSTCEEPMRMRTLVLVATFCGVVSPLHGQEPVVGVKDPESLFKSSDPKLNRNKQASLHIM